MEWLVMIVEAVACSAMLFIAHSFPANTKYIERRMAKGDKSAFVLGLFYYALFLTVPIFLSHWLLLHKK